MNFVFIISILLYRPLQNHSFFTNIQKKTHFFLQNRFLFSKMNVEEKEKNNIILVVNTNINEKNSSESSFHYPSINPFLPKSPTICCPFPPFPPPPDKDKNFLGKLISFLEKMNM